MLAFAVASVIEVLVEDSIDHRPAVAVIALGWSVPFVFRNRHPFAVPVTVAGALVLLSFVAGHDAMKLAMPFFAALLAAASFGQLRTRRLAYAGLAVIGRSCRDRRLLGGRALGLRLDDRRAHTRLGGRPAPRSASRAGPCAARARCRRGARAHADRARAARRRRALGLRDGRPGVGGAAAAPGRSARASATHCCRSSRSAGRR